MKNRIKMIALICFVIVAILAMAYYHIFVYGSHVSTDYLFDVNADVNGSIVTITGDTAGSGDAFAGYDTVWVADELWIKPRYSIVSKFNPSGRMEIVYDAKDRPLHKVFLVGATEDDKKQIWPVIDDDGTSESAAKSIAKLEYSNQEPVNPGYRVILTDFFSFEVPDGWTATSEQDADTLMINLSNKAGIMAGSIGMLPEGADLMPLTPSDSFEQKIHENAENGQQTIVTVFLTDQMDQRRANMTADMIADSIKEKSNKIKSPGVIGVGKHVSVDLNGDGKDEAIYYGLDDFKVNGASYKKLIQSNVYENNPLGDNYIISDINTSDSQMEIGLRVDGPSDDPETFFFTYDGKKLLELGSIPSAIDDLTRAFNGKGSIYGILRLNILQTWYAPAEWALNANQTIKLKEQSVYDPIHYDTDLPVELNVPLPIYQKLGDSKPAATMEPQNVKLTATDNKNWCMVEGEDGTKGWFRIEGYSTVSDLGIDASSVFSNLCMAD
jgi:hypothetical protein